MTREEAQDYVKIRHDAVQLATEIARGGVAKAQQQQVTQANKKRRELDFDVGDYVYLTPKGFTTSRPSAKLDQQMYGPYPITGMKGHSYQVALPPNMQMSNIFHADCLRKASPPLPGQIEPEEPPTIVNGEPEWEMDGILDSRIYRKRLQYKAAWVGYDPDSTWYNARRFISAPHKIRDFHSAYPGKAGPSHRLNEWFKAWENDDERGAEVDIPGLGRILLAFPLAFIDDMPQQQKNSGMKTQRAKLGCRLCHIDSEQRGDLDFDTFLEGRYHHTVMSMREDLEAQPTRQAREAYDTNWGIDLNPGSMVPTKLQEDHQAYDLNNPLLGNTKLLNSFFKYSHVLEFLQGKNKTVLLELVGKPGTLKLEPDLEEKLGFIEEQAIAFMNETHAKINNLVRSLRQALRTEAQNTARKQMADFRALDSTSTREYFKLFPRLFSFLTRGYYTRSKSWRSWTMS